MEEKNKILEKEKAENGNIKENESPEIEEAVDGTENDACEKEDTEEEQESWSEFYARRLKESAKAAMPNISWYLSEQIFAERPQGLPGTKLMKYRPSGLVIPLPGRYLNIWTLKDEKRIAQALGMAAKDIEKVNYFACYIVTSSSCGLKAGTVLPEKELTEALEKYGKTFSTGIGAEGLLEYAEKNGKKMPGMIGFLPIIYPYGEEKTLRNKRFFCEFRDDLAHLYVTVMDRADRIRKLDKIHAPAIIMRNERRMMQELLDGVIHNGLRGKPRTGYRGLPCFSWNDMEV